MWSLPNNFWGRLSLSVSEANLHAMSRGLALAGLEQAHGKVLECSWQRRPRVRPGCRVRVRGLPKSFWEASTTQKILNLNKSSL